jgi:hypothetical protein
VNSVRLDLDRVNKLASDAFFLHHFTFFLLFGYFGHDKLLASLAIPTQNIEILHGQTKGIHLAVARSTGRVIAALINIIFNRECFRGRFQGFYFKIIRKFQLQPIDIFSHPGTPIERIRELAIGGHHQNSSLC